MDEEKKQYFVLDLDNDPYARLALEVYAVAVSKEDPKLSNHIWKAYLNRAGS